MRPTGRPIGITIFNGASRTNSTPWQIARLILNPEGDFGWAAHSLAFSTSSCVSWARGMGGALALQAAERPKVMRIYFAVARQLNWTFGAGALPELAASMSSMLPGGIVRVWAPLLHVVLEPEMSHLRS
jgi:hypothetical protein